MKKLKNLLKVGTFGRMVKGQNFVIVKDGYVAYQHGGFDYIDGVLGEMHVYGGVDKLVDCDSFNQLDTKIKKNRDIIYDREKEEAPIEMTIAEIEAKLGIKNLKIKKEGK